MTLGGYSAPNGSYNSMYFSNLINWMHRRRLSIVVGGLGTTHEFRSNSLTFVQVTAAEGFKPLLSPAEAGTFVPERLS